MLNGSLTYQTVRDEIRAR